MLMISLNRRNVLETYLPTTEPTSPFASFDVAILRKCRLFIRFFYMSGNWILYESSNINRKYPIFTM